MAKDTSINLVELLPYGSFPTTGYREITSDLRAAVTSLAAFDAERARYWFEIEEAEVA